MNDKPPTLTELINMATSLASDIDTKGLSDMTSIGLKSIAFSQIAIARSLSHQTDIMAAILKNMPTLREDQK